MSDDEVLTKEIAEQFLADEDSVDLSEFTAIEDEAAQVLVSDTTEFVRGKFKRLATELNNIAASTTFHASEEGCFGESHDEAAAALFSLLPRVAPFAEESRDWELSLDFEIFSFSEKEISQNTIKTFESNPAVSNVAYLFVPASTLAAFPDDDLFAFYKDVGRYQSEFWYEDLNEEKSGIIIPLSLLVSLITPKQFFSVLDLDNLTTLSDYAATLLLSYDGIVYMDVDALPSNAAAIFRNATVSPVRKRGFLSEQIAKELVNGECSELSAIYIARRSCRRYIERL